MPIAELIGITGTSSYFPKRKVSVEELLRKAGSNLDRDALDPGVSHIHIAEPNEDSFSMAAKAAKAAIDDAKLDEDVIGLVIYCDGVSQTRYERTYSHELIKRLKTQNAYGFDVEGGFIVSLMAIQIAKDLLVNSVNLQHAIVVSAHKFEESAYYKGEKSRLASGIFGDGAAAVVLSKNSKHNLILATSFVMDHYTDLTDELINRELSWIKSTSPFKKSLLKFPLPKKMYFNKLLSQLASRAAENSHRAINFALLSVNLGIRDVDLFIKSRIVLKETAQLLNKLDLTKSSIYNASSEKGNLGHADTLSNIHLALKNAEIVDLDIILVVASSYDCSAGALVLRR